MATVVTTLHLAHTNLRRYDTTLIKVCTTVLRSEDYAERADRSENRARRADYNRIMKEEREERIKNYQKLASKNLPLFQHSNAV